MRAQKIAPFFFLRVINFLMMMKNDHSPSQARSTHTEVEKAWRFCVGAGHPSGIKKAINTPKHFTGQLFEGDSSDPWGNGWGLWHGVRNEGECGSRRAEVSTPERR